MDFPFLRITEGLKERRYADRVGVKGETEGSEYVKWV